MPTLAIEPIIELLARSDSAQVEQVDPDAWDAIAVTAIALGLAPLLHWRLESHHSRIPAMALAKLAVTRQAHAKRNEAIARQLADILTGCRRCSIPVIVLKGALLAQAAYPDPALRPMNDIDLLFQPDDLPRVDSLLRELGYHGKTKPADSGAGVTKHLSTYRRDGSAAATPNPYLSAAAERMVEPHRSLEESWFGLKADVTPGVWDRAQAITLSGEPALRLSATDMLLHLAVHATFHVIMGASVFVQLYDIGQTLSTWPAEIEWPALVALARQAEASPFVYAALSWAQRLYGVDIPGPALLALQENCPARLQTYIHRLDAAALFKRTQQPPLTSFSQRVQRGFVDRRETARWAGSLPKKWRVWQTALAVHKTDTLNLLLGKQLKAET